MVLYDVETMTLAYTFPFSLSCLKFDEPSHRLFTNSGSVIKVLSIKDRRIEASLDGNVINAITIIIGENYLIHFDDKTIVIRDR